MNIFVLDTNLKKCAEYHVDRHIVKMPTEMAQMISFAYYHNHLWNKPIPDFIMKFSKTHNLHPCSKWIRESRENFIFACQLGLELYNEYQYRYNKPDKHQRAKSIFEFGLANVPNLESKGLTPFVCAMSDNFIISKCGVTNYRNYYILDKSHLHTWKKRETPFFICTKENKN